MCGERSVTSAGNNDDGGPVATRRSPRRRLFVDVSLIGRQDAGTGIQRVVRSVLQSLAEDPERNFDLIPVAGFRWWGYRRVRPDFLQVPVPKRTVPHPGNALRPRRGDVFLGLDLAPHIVSRSARQLGRWRARGVSLAFVVYDLLPLQRPEWFTPAAQARFSAWFAAVARLADCLVCISGAVRKDLRAFLDTGSCQEANRPRLATLRLGGQIAQSSPSRGLPDDLDALLSWIQGAQTVLVVGTIEPRKGHDEVLAAFDLIWARQGGPHPRLLLVGKPGWGTEILQDRIRAHPAAGRNLRWLSGASDELLDRLYAACHGVMVPSRAEGFGLPLLEAVCHGKPILARDLPVFREFAPPEVGFFTCTDSSELAGEILQWLMKGRPATSPVDRYDWGAAAAQIREILAL